jgi:LCP family protein required for cell wall assembly
MSENESRRGDTAGHDGPAGAENPTTPLPAGASGTAETGTEEKGPEGGKPQGKVRTRRQKILRRTAAGAAAVMLLAGGGLVALYYDIMRGVEQEKVDDELLGPNRPPKLNKSLNILLLGSDSRAGQNSRYGAAAGMSGARSDTAILLHLSPNRDQAVGISFPRDSMVRIPECKKESGTVPGRFGMLNTAFAYAGPSCTWKTLESLTGIHIDHFVQIDFTGFKRMVDALDGVEICVERPVNDPRAELNLKAGKQTVKGEDALGYVRARYSLGNGSDLERIERQQKFMAAVVDKATSSEILTDPAQTYRFLKAASKSITTDEDLDLNAMRKLAEGVRGMSAGQVRFLTVPVERYAPDPNRVQWNQKQAKPLFEAIQHDNDLPAAPARPVKEQALPAPGKVKVTVVDAGAADKTVKRIVNALKSRGFAVQKKVEQAAAGQEHRIMFAAAAEGQANALARVLPTALLTPDARVPADGVRLVVGKPDLQLAAQDIKNINGGVKAGQNPCK